MAGPFPGYFPRYTAEGGNPWQSVANAYGSELDRSQALLQQGYQQAANAPSSLYDKFLQGYMTKLQMERQAQADQLAQAQLDRQNRLADLAENRQDSQDEQNRLKDLAGVQSLIASKYTPALRPALRTQLKSIFPDKEDAELEAMLPALTKQTVQVGQNDPLPLNPSTPGVPDKMDDNFLGADIQKERDQAKQAGEKNVLLQAMDRMKAEHAMELQRLKGSQGLQQLQVKIDAGAFQKKGDTAGAALWDATSPQDKKAAMDLAKQWVKEGTPPSGIGRNKRLLDLTSHAYGLLTEGQDIDLPSAKADYKANSGSLSDIRKMTDKVNAFERTALGNWNAYEQQMGKLGNTASPFLNKPINNLKVLAAGNPDVVAASAAGRVAINEISRVLNSANAQGVVSDTARREVESVLPNGFENATLGQVLAVGKILKGDMERRRTEYAKQIEEIQGRIGGKGSQGGGPKAGDVQDGYRFKGGDPADQKNWEKV